MQYIPGPALSRVTRRGRTDIDTDTMQAWIRRYLAYFEDFEPTSKTLVVRYGWQAVRQRLRERAREYREINEERYDRLRAWVERSPLSEEGPMRCEVDVSAWVVSASEDALPEPPERLLDVSAGRRSTSQPERTHGYPDGTRSHCRNSS